MILTIEELQELKKTSHYSYRQIAEKSGLPIGTVQKVLGGITKTPRRETLEALTKVLAGEKVSYKTMLDKGTPLDQRYMVHEVEHAYAEDPEVEEGYRLDDAVERLLDSKKSGEFTVEDYYVISEKYRIELIDGEIYDMAAPEFDHQHIAGLVYTQMIIFREENHEKCIPGIAPLDVQLDCDDKTMVQPDLIVFCDKKMNHKKVIFGAPDFVMEVFSPSSRYKDRIKKRDKYRAAGCREYWMVDPLNQRVTVLDFEGGLDGIYTFDQKIPVRISGGRCIIDFSKIKKDLIEIGEL